MNKKIMSLFIVVTLCASSAHAAVKSVSSQKNDFSISLGNLCEYIGKMQTDENGGANVCSFLPSLAGNFDYFFTPSFALSPQIGATLPKSGRDENITRMTMFVLLNAKYKMTYANLIVGTGIYFTRVSGSGGEETLNNGNSTESFPLPKESVYSRNIIFNLGTSMDFNPNWSAELYTYIFNIEDSKERAFSAGISLSYHFGAIL
ncbi:MAG: transporter [Bdellovibrionales bacterium]|nr:transporter [Bdellovibrionales bacterium]